MTWTYTGIRSPSASRSATKTGVMVIEAGACIGDRRIVSRERVNRRGEAREPHPS